MIFWLMCTKAFYLWHVQETSALVDKQSDAMLKLIKDQKDQLAKDMQEQLQNAKVSIGRLHH